MLSLGNDLNLEGRGMVNLNKKTHHDSEDDD